MKKELKGKKIKQTAFASAAIAATVVPAVTSVFVISKDDMKKANRATKQAANAAQQVVAAAPAPALTERQYINYKTQLDYTYIYFSDTELQQIIDFETSRASNLVAFLNANFPADTTPISQMQSVKDDFDQFKLSHNIPQTTSSATQSQNILSSSSSSWLKPLTDLPRSTSYYVSDVDAQSITTQLNSMFRSMTVSGSFSGSVSGGDATLHLSSGLQKPQLLDSLFQRIHNLLYTTSQQELENKFEVYYTIGNDQTKHYMVQNGQGWGVNSWVLGPDFKAQAANGQIPDLHFFGAISDPLHSEIHNYGVSLDVNGGTQPSALFRGLTDFQQYATGHGPVVSTSTSSTTSSTTQSISGVKIGSLVMSRNYNDFENTHANTLLSAELARVVSQASFTGNTMQTTITFPTMFNQNILATSGDLATSYDGSDNYKPQAKVKMYYSVGSSSVLHAISSSTVTISGADALALNAQGTDLPQIHFFLGLDQSAATRTTNNQLVGWTNGNPNVAYVDIAGVQLTPSFKGSNGLPSAVINKLRDVVQKIDAPQFKDETLPTRTTVEAPERGLIAKEIINGVVQQKPIIKYEYRLKNAPQGTRWLSQADFFGAGKPGSTVDVYNGIEWRAVETNGGQIVLGTTKFPTGTSYDSVNNAITGIITPARPTVSHVEVPQAAGGGDDSHYFFTNLTPGLRYQFTLQSADGTFSHWLDANGKPNPYDASPKYADEIKDLNAKNQLPSLFDEASGKFKTVQYSVYDPNIDFSGILTQGQTLLNGNVNGVSGFIHLTPNDLPSATRHAKLQTFTSPIVDAASVDTGHIKINLPAFSPMNFEYSIDGKDWTLKLDANGILVHADGSPLNAWNGASKANVQWRVNAQNPIKSGLFIDYVGPTTPAAFTGTLDLDKVVGGSTYSPTTISIPKLITDLKTTGSNSEKPGLATSVSTSIFDLLADSQFQVPFEYSIDGKTWVSRADFLKTSVNGHVQNFNAAFNGPRNLFDGTKNRPILVRTKPQSALKEQEKYVFDQALLTKLGWTKDADGTYHFSIDTSTLAHAIDSTFLEASAHVPSVTGASTTQYDIVVPTVAHVSYQFKLQSEDDSKWTNANDFKTKHTNITTTNAQGQVTPATLVWRAVAETGYSFADSSKTIHDKNWIEASTGKFNPQVLPLPSTMVANIPHHVVAPTLAAGSTNTSNVRINSQPEQGLSYSYSVDGGTNWFKLASATEAIPQARLLDAQGHKVAQIKWRADFTSPHIPAAGATVTGEIAGWSAVKIAVSSAPEITASMFTGTDSKNWVFNDAPLKIAGLVYEVTIDGTKYTLDSLKAQAGKLNLFDETTKQFKNISWTVTPAQGYEFVGSFKKANSFKVSLPKFISTLVAPQITGTISSAWNFDVKQDSSSIEFKYSTDGKTWETQADFMAKHTNLYDVANNKMIEVHYQAIVKPGYVLDSSIAKEGVIALPDSTKMTRDGGTIVAPIIGGTTSQDYTLISSVGNQYDIKYSATQNGPWQTADEFKHDHPNLWVMPGSMTPIYYSIVAKTGFNFHASPNLNQNVVSTSTLAAVIDETLITAPAFTGTSSIITDSAIQLTSRHKFAGVDYVFGTDANIDASTGLTWENFVKAHPNIYDTATDSVLPIYWLPIATTQNGHPTSFKNAPHATQLTLPAITKVISVVSTPTLTSTTNKTDDYSVTFADKHLVVKIGTQAPGEDIATFKAHTPNLFDGTRAETLKWFVSAEAGYAIAAGQATSGTFTYSFDKVFDSIQAPSFKSNDANGFDFTLPQVTGIDYKFYVGTDVSHAVDYTTFKQQGLSAIFDSTANKYKEVHWVATPQTGYAIKTGVTSTDVIDFATAKLVISDVKPPVFDATKTQDSSTWVITQPDPKDAVTQFRIAGTNAWLDMAGLTRVIASTYHGNLWDRATDKFLDIEWKISPVGQNSIFEPGTQTAGHLDMQKMSDGTSMLKFIPIETHIPRIAASSTDTAHLTIENLDPLLDYKFAIEGNTDFKPWTDFIAANKNLYDSLSGALPNIVWTATAKAGYRTEIHATATQTTPKTNTIIVVTQPKFIDQMNPLTLTGTSTSQFGFNGQTQGASYVVSTTETGTFIPVADFIKAGNFAATGAMPELWYKVVSADTSKYVVDPNLKALKLDTSSLKIALSSPTSPLISTAQGKNISNHFELNQGSLSEHVDYMFTVPNLEKGVWFTLADLIAKHGSEIYNPVTNVFETIMWKAQPQTGYVWDSTSTIVSEGQLSTTHLVKYVSTVTDLGISWAPSAVHKSNNYILLSPMQDSKIIYEISYDGGASWHGIQARQNLYDSVKGDFKDVQWRAHVEKDAKNDGLHTGSTSTDYWTGKVDLSQITTRVIDSVPVPKIAATNGGQITSVVADNVITASLPHVTYLFADKTAQDAKLLSDIEFAKAHPNIFNSQTLKMDQIVWAVNTETGYEFASTIQNTENSGVQAASNLDLTGMIGVISTVPAPGLSGTAQAWTVHSAPTIAYTYEFKVDGISDASNTFKSLADLKAAYPSLSIAGVNHGVVWQAVPTSSAYKFGQGVVTTGTMNALSDNLEISAVAAPVLTFTDSHLFTIDRTAFTRNVNYQFRIEGTQTWMSPNDFLKNRNLYDAQTDTLQKIEWQALADTSNANAVFHFASSLTQADTHGVITPSTNKFLGTIIAPTLLNPTAKSTDLAFVTLSSHVTYDFLVDGVLVSSGTSFSQMLKHAYANAIMTNTHHDPVITWTVKPDKGYAIDQTTTSGTIDTSGVIKVVTPKPVVLDASSVNTSDYSISSETKFAARYEISLDGGKTWEALSSQFDKTHPLFTIDGGLKTMNWHAIVETGYAFDSQDDHGVVDLTSLKKVLDNLPLPTLTGTTSINWAIDIDAKYKPYFNYEYSLDGGQTYVSATELKTKIANGNLYDSATGTFRQITVHSVVDTTKFDFGSGVNAKKVNILTDKLIGIIDSVVAPTLNKNSIDSSDFNIDETQPNVKYEYWVDGSRHFASVAELKQNVQNLYVFKNGTWVMRDIHWLASAASAKFQIPATVTHEGVISTQTLDKVIELSPTFAATGSSVNFAIEDVSSHQEFSIPGLSVVYKIGSQVFHSQAEINTYIQANPTFNLFDDSLDSWKQISFEISDSTGYIFKGQATGQVDTSNLKRIISSFDNNWIPELSSGSTQWNYDLVASPLSNSLSGKLIYQFATSATAADSEWKTKDAFKAANPTLLNLDQSNKHVFWRVIVDPTQASKFEFAAGVVHSGEVTLPLATVVTRVEAPTPKTGSVSNRIELLEPTEHVQYLYSLTPTGSYVDLLTLQNQHNNLYDAANNAWKHLYYQAVPDTGYTFAQGQEFKGEVNFAASHTRKVIDSYVAPVLVAVDSMHYSLAAPQGQTLTSGLEYDLTVTLTNGTTISMKPSDLMNSGVNLFDQTTGKPLQVKYEVISVDSSYKLVTPVNEGPLTIPATMKNVVQSVVAPTFTTSSTTTEDWDLTLQAENGFHFEFDIAGNHFKSLAELKAGIANQNIFIKNNLENISWKAVPDASTIFAAGVKTNDVITSPATLTRMLDAVALPQITGQTSTTYGITAQTSHVSYEFRLASEDDTNWKSSSDFVSSHHNIFNEVSGRMFVIQWKAVADQGFGFSSSVDASHRAGQITPAVTPIIETVNPVAFIASGTTKQYAFDIPSSSLVDYLFATSENGQFVRADQFLQDPANANLYSASTDTLKPVWWKAVPKVNTMQIATSTVSKLQIANEDSLTKVVEVDSNGPTFGVNSGTTSYSIDVPSSQIWIDRYEFRMEGESTYTDLAKFLTDHKDITSAKQNGLHIEWQSIYKAGFASDTGVTVSGQMDMASLQTQISTANVHLDQIQIAPRTSAYEFINLPSIQVADGYRLEIKWGDEQDWISALDASWPFSSANPQLQLWDNNFANPDGSFGAWKHGGQIQFRLAPVDPANVLTNAQLTTFEFEKADNGQPLTRIINNSRLASTTDTFDPATDRVTGFVPGFGKIDSQAFGGQVAASNSASVSLVAHEEHNLMQHHTMTFVNPFMGMNDAERDALVDLISDASFAHIAPQVQALIAGNLLPQGFDRNALVTFLKSRNADASFLQPYMFSLTMGAIGNIWDGSKWLINEIDAKTFAVDGDIRTTSLLTIDSSSKYQLENQGSRIVWTPSMNTIAKLVDNQPILDLAQQVITPGAMPGSLHDNIIWGDQNAVDDLIQQAANKGLVVQLSMDEDPSARLWYDLFDENDPKDFRNMFKKISSVHASRHLYLRVVSTDTDDAMNGVAVKVSNEAEIDITSTSKIQEVKTHWTEKSIDTTSVIFSGTTLDPVVDTSALDLTTDLNPTTPEIDNLEMTFQNPENPNQWMPLDDFISYMKMKARLGQSISGEDIKVKFDVPQSLSNLYAISKPIIGSVDYSKLYEFIDINEYVEALKNIQVEGVPSTDLTNKDRTIYIATDSMQAKSLASDEFRNQFAIQYQIINLDGTKGPWQLFEPEMKDLAPDFAHNVLAHPSGTYMNISMLPDQAVSFRIIPIATSQHDVKVTKANEGVSQQEALELTRILTSDYNQQIPDAQGTIVTIKASDILSSGEHMLEQWISNNAVETSRLENIEDQILDKQKSIDTLEAKIDALKANNPNDPAIIAEQAKLDAELIAIKTLQTSALSHEVLDASWIAPFYTLITSRPKFEEIKDELIDPTLLSSGQLIPNLADAAVINDLVSRGIINQADKTIIQDAINSFGKGHAKIAQLLTQTSPEAKEELELLTTQIYQFIIRMGSDASMENVISLKTTTESEKVHPDGSIEVDANGNPVKVSSEVFVPTIFTELLKAMRQERIETQRTLKGDPNWVPQSVDDMNLVSVSRIELIQTIMSGPSSTIKKAIEDAISKSNGINITADFTKLADLIQDKFFDGSYTPTSQEIITRLYASQEKDLITRLMTVDNTHSSDIHFNRDIDADSSRVFDVTQIGSGEVDAYGQKFTHSNTIFFGNNAIRFNIEEDPNTGAKHIVDAYLVAEDSQVAERIAHIHLSNYYSLEEMSLVLELENGDTVYLQKQVTSATLETIGQELVRFIRLESKKAQDGTLLDMSQNGAIWKHYSETIINNQDSKVQDDSTQIESLDVLGQHLKTQAAEIQRQWVATQSDLEDRTAKNELPFDLAAFDNRESDPTSLDAIDLGIQTPWDIQAAKALTSPASNIYGSPAAIQPLSNGNGVQLAGFDSVANFNQGESLVYKVYHATVNSEGYVVIEKMADDGSFEGGKVMIQNAKEIKVVLIDENGKSTDSSNGEDSSFPLWAILVSSIGGAGVLGGAGYLGYNKFVAKKAGKVKKPKLK